MEKKFKEFGIVDFNNLEYENILYLISDEYYKLNEDDKYYFNEIIRYCENEGKYPETKDFRNKFGYISSSIFKSRFGSDKKDLLRKYINEVWSLEPQHKKTIPYGVIVKFIKNKKCDICECVLSINNFKYGSNRCKECSKNIGNHLSNMRLYKEKYNIEIKEYSDIPPIEWYNLYINKNMKQMPNYIYTKDHMKEILRYLILDVEKMTLYEILSKTYCPWLDNVRLRASTHSVFGGVTNMLNYCFEDIIPYKIKENYTNFLYCDDIGIKMILDKIVIDNKFSIEDILCQDFHNNNFRDFLALMANKRDDRTSNIMWLSYINDKGYFNDKYNRKYHAIDFSYRDDGLWECIDNRILAIKNYCEYDCDNILNHFHNKDELLVWLRENFTTSNASKIIPVRSRYYDGIYQMITEAYPELIKDKILFEWEWTQYNSSNKEDLIAMMREFILYRCDFEDLKSDIPKNINRVFIMSKFSKMNKQIDKYRFESYFEWCSLAFPEYSNSWRIEDFEKCVADDGTACDSYEEVYVYNVLKSEFNNLEYIGRKRSSDLFSINYDGKNMRFCPDFKINLIDKPLYIEYYGLYEENNDYEMIKKYVKKTKLKNDYYKSLDNIYFIDIYPKDLKNGLSHIKGRINNIIKESE